MEHYNDNKWDMYAGVQAVMNVSVSATGSAWCAWCQARGSLALSVCHLHRNGPQRLTNMLPGDMGRVLSAMVDVVVPSTRVILNVRAWRRHSTGCAGEQAGRT